MGLNKIEKPEPLAKTAFRALRHSILANELTAGIVYNEKRLANDLGISRTPVREALLELSAKRLIKFLPQKGVVVNTFSENEIDDVFEIRTTLEVFSIQKICSKCSRQDYARLMKLFLEQKVAARKNDKIVFMDADRRYHICFTSLTNNKYLMEMMQDIRDIMHLMGIKAIDLEGRIQQVVEEHEKIQDAISKGDTGKAVEEMISHLEKSREAIKAVG